MAEPTIAGIPTKDFDKWQAERVASGRAHVNDGGTMAGAEFATPVDVAAKADASALTAHTSDTANPHDVTKEQVGLGNVANTAPADLPISDATQSALDGKVATSDLPGGDPADLLTVADIDGSDERGVQAHSDVLDNLAEDSGVLSTGWRNIASLLYSNWELDESGNYLHLARIGKTVHLAGSISPAAAIWGTNRVGNNILLNATLPSGFQIRRAGTVFGTAARQTNGSLGFLWAPAVVRVDIRMVVEASTWADGDSVQFSASWPTGDAWPSSLPGVAV